MNKRIYLALVCIALFLSPNSSSAQFGSFGASGFGHSSYQSPGITYAMAKERGYNLKPWWRSDIGFYMPFGTATFIHTARTFDNNNSLLTLKSRSTDVALTPSFGVTEGLFAPIVTLPDKSMIAFSYSGIFYMAKFSLPQQDYGSTYGAMGGDCKVMEGGLALSLDYKTGCDAELDNKKKTGLSFGAGFYPNILISTFKQFGSGSFTADPFIKADLSFFLGVCFKLRAMCIFRNGSYLETDKGNLEGSYSDAANSLSITGSTSFSLSLLVLPYSWDWGND